MHTARNPRRSIFNWWLPEIDDYDDLFMPNEESRGHLRRIIPRNNQRAKTLRSTSKSHHAKRSTSKSRHAKPNRTRKVRSSFERVKHQLLKQGIRNALNMLQHTCRNSGHCLALGVYGNYIKHQFNDFQNLSDVSTSKVKQIGSDSVNGKVFVVPFVKNGYTAYTALKCTRHAYSDNLFYEYFIGKYFINTLLAQFPCFVETYYMCLFNSTTDYDEFMQLPPIDNIGERLVKSIRPIIRTYDYDIRYFPTSCVKPTMIGVLIQHFDRFTSVGDAINKCNADTTLVIYDILYWYWQVYWCLSILEHIYTHYDMHYYNVYLYKPYDGKKYILMRYHYTDSNNKSVVMEFKSEYVVKIIDYGRNYFQIKNGLSTNDIVSNYLNDPLCSNRGKASGYRIIRESHSPDNTYDLQFVENINDKINRYVKRGHTRWKDMLVLIDTHNIPFGQVHTVSDMINHLHTRLSESHWFHHKYTDEWVHAATMNIYNDGRDYTFTVEPTTD
jgi:hypothetical protein